MARHKIMAVFNKAPYERISIIEGARAVAGVVTMGTEGTAVFIDDGVYALLKNQDPSGARLESIIGWLRLLEKSKVPMKVVHESLRERGIEESELLDLDSLEVISREQLGELMLNHNSVFVL